MSGLEAGPTGLTLRGEPKAVPVSVAVLEINDTNVEPTNSKKIKMFAIFRGKPYSHDDGAL